MAARTLLRITLASLAVAAAVGQPEDYLGAQCIGDVCDNGLPCLTLTGEDCPLDRWTFENPHSCTCGGVGGESDPYFTGFYGQSFYFPAEANRTYNIFSEQSHLVNAHFVPTELPEASDLTARLSGARNSSFIGAVTFRHDYTLVEVSADRKGNLAININGEPLPLGEDEVDLELSLLLGLGVDLTVRKFQLPYLNEVHIETELLCASITPEMEHTDNLGSIVRGHLSLQLNLKREAWHSGRRAHGILGQTAEAGVNSDELDMFPGEGSPEDYEVSTLSSHDFAFNLYDQDADLDPARLQGAQLAKRRPGQPDIAVSRRLLAGKAKGSEEALAAGVRSQWADARRRRS